MQHDNVHKVIQLYKDTYIHAAMTAGNLSATKLAVYFGYIYPLTFRHICCSLLSSMHSLAGP